jgi:ATP-dependent helicase/nuclease subunit A
VGDPKQSIFRFRRADIDVYNRVAQRIKDTGGEVLLLTANFRSLPSVCAVANTVFPPLFANKALPYSPAFAELDPVREEPAPSDHPSVATITIPDSQNFTLPGPTCFGCTTSGPGASGGRGAAGCTPREGSGAGALLI